MVALPIFRRRVSFGCGVLLSLLAAVDLVLMLLGTEYSIFTVLKDLIVAALGFGLLLGNVFARRATALLLVVVAIGLPIGYLNPFNASDMMAEGGTAPTVTAVLLWMVPLEIALLFLAWAVDPLRGKTKIPERTGA